MPTILLKKSDTPGSVPGTANLTNLAGGVEVAVNTADKRVYSMTSASAVIELGTNPSSLTCADVSATVFRSASATITNLIATSASITTLTNNPTFGAGTANGVLFLNGSKVATSGSALQFDGTGKLALGNVAHISFIPATALTLGNSAANVEIRMGQQDTNALISKWVYNATVGSAYGAIETYGQTNYIQFGASDFRWQAASSERMRLTSSVLSTDSSINVGIGTASPGRKLDVVAANNTAIRALSGASGSYVSYGVGRTAEEAYISIAAAANNFITGSAAGDLTINNNAGNVLITAGGSATQLYLNTSGNLGLGVTPSAWATYKATQVGWSALAGYAAADTAVFSNAFFDGGYKYIGNGFASQYRQLNSAHQWFTAPSWDGTGSNAISFTQAMTLDASGNLGVGTTSPAFRLDLKGSGATSFAQMQDSTAVYKAIYGVDSGVGVEGAVAGALTNHPFIFRTNNTERARITSGGDLYVGCTAAPSATVSGVSIRNPVSSGASTFSSGTTNSATLVAFTNNNGQVGRIDVAGTATSYVTSSDRRLKESIVFADDAGAIVDAIEVVKHDWKSGGHVRFGMIAQDLHKVAPEAVSAGDDGEEIEKTWGVDYSKLVPMLVKEVQSLRKRVAELESK